MLAARGKIFASLLLVSLSFPSHGLDAGGWIDTVKEGYDQLSTLGAAPADETASTRPLPQGLPSHWRSRYLHEPILRSDIFVTEVGDSQKPLLLLVHGLGQNGGRDWNPVLPVLAKYYRVLVVDLPGFGFSDQPAKKLSPSAYAALLHWLKSHYSYDPITVIGHSMGGAVSLRYAADFPGDITQLVLVDAAGILHRTAFVKHSALAQVDINMEAMPNGLLGYAANLHSVGSSLIERLLHLPNPSAYLSRSNTAWGVALVKVPNINAALALTEEDFSAAVYGVTAKTSLIWGMDDPVAPLRTGKVLARHMTAARLYPIAGAQHVPMISHPELFNQVLMAALREPKGRALDNLTGHNEGTHASCENRVGQVISGRYDTIDIRNCRALRLVDVTANHLHIVHSLVEMENVAISSDTTAMIVKDSVVVATNIDLRGDTAMESHGSRLDLAGAILRGRAVGLSAVGKSRVVASVCRLETSGYNGFLHGDFQLENQRLENRVSATK